MEVIRSSETSFHTRSTWRHIPEYGILKCRLRLRKQLKLICTRLGPTRYRVENEVLLITETIA
jgi:hypothetical protein